MLTLNAFSGLTRPSDANYKNSFIATCDSVGSQIQLSATSPFGGNKGFRINNVGNVDTYFPVAATYLPADNNAPPSPNRMMINNRYTPTHFTVVVNKGDIGNTPAARVNRIWYVKAASDTAVADMKLYFTMRDPTEFGVIQNEVESGFMYTDVRILQRDYTSNPHFIAISDFGDIKSFPFNPGNEAYGQYTYGVSPDALGRKIGMTEFNRFTVGNKGSIILPVNIISFNAYQSGNKVLLKWTSLNEVDVDHYEVERSHNGSQFNTIGKVTARNSGTSAEYDFVDGQPFNSDNFYRIKAVDKNGSVSFTRIIRITLSGIVPSITVYPNPVTDKRFTVQMNNVDAGIYHIVLFNVLGKKLMEQKTEHPGGSASLQITLPSGILPGTYQLSFSGNNKVYLKKVIIH